MAITVDTRGKLCPLPLIMLRKAIKEHSEEQRFDVLTDNATACGNLTDFVTQNGFLSQTIECEGYTLLAIDMKGQEGIVKHPSPTPTATASLPSRHGIVVQLANDVMGGGERQLGELLIQAFLNTLVESDTLPTHVVCYNAGAKLATSTHPAHTALQRLADKGVSIIVCGTCIDYYDLRPILAVGKISNMYVIVETLSQADRVLRP